MDCMDGMKKIEILAADLSVNKESCQDRGLHQLAIYNSYDWARRAAADDQRHMIWEKIGKHFQNNTQEGR